MSYDYNRAVQIFQQARYGACTTTITTTTSVVTESEVLPDHDATTAATISTTDAVANTDEELNHQQQLQQRKEHYQLAIETIEALSTKCPMTPLLWIQYADTFYHYYMICCTTNAAKPTTRGGAEAEAAVAETRTATEETGNHHKQKQIIAAKQLEHQTLSLGLVEFPGSAMLQLRSVIVQVQIILMKYNIQQEPKGYDRILFYAMMFRDIEIIVDSFIRKLLHQVEHGSHKGDDVYIVGLYQCCTILSILQYQLLKELQLHLEQKYEQQRQDYIDDNDSEPDDDEVYVETIIFTKDDDEVMVDTNTIIQTCMYVQDLYISRSKCPMITQNDNLMQQIQQLQALWKIWILDRKDDEPIDHDTSAIFYKRIQEGRIYEAKVYHFMNHHEAMVQQSMNYHDQIHVPSNLFVFNQQQQQSSQSSVITSTSTFKEKISFVIQQLEYYCSNQYINWNVLLEPISPQSTLSYGMGLGGINTVQIFLKYIQDVKHHLFSIEKIPELRKKNDVNYIKRHTTGICRMIISMYERAIAECPCIELLWISYIRELQSWMMIHPTTTTSTTNKSTSSKDTNEKQMIQQKFAYENLKQVSNRAFRNCPYSTTLLQQKYECILLLSNPSKDNNATGNTVPKEILHTKQLLSNLQDGIDLGFLSIASSQQLFDVYIIPIRIIKRRIMMLLHEMDHIKKNEPIIDKTNKKKKKQQQKQKTLEVLFYDDSEPMPSITKDKKQSVNVAEDNEEDVDNEDVEYMKLEVESLVDEIIDLYEDIKTSIGAYISSRNSSNPIPNNSISFTDVCSLIYNERALSELLLLHPLRTVLFLTRYQSENDSDTEDEEVQNGTLLRVNNMPTPAFLYYDLCIRSHNPPHPYTYNLCIQEFIHFIIHPITKKQSASATITTLCDVLIHIRQIRGLYTQAIGAVGKGKSKQDQQQQQPPKSLLKTLELQEKDYETSLYQLCQEWLNFERVVGSPRSYGKASTLIDKKLQKLQSTAGNNKSRNGKTASSSTETVTTAIEHVPTESDVGTSSNVAEIKGVKLHSRDDLSQAIIPDTPATIDTSNDITDTKRKHEAISATENVEAQSNDHDEDYAKKKVKVTSDSIIPSDLVDDATMSNGINKPTLKNTKIKTVRVGNMDYPVHPYTICVSNLAQDTEDMDLVDTFRPLCGPIVHARIVREKYSGNGFSGSNNSTMHKGKSKGYGYIQFEQIESVNKALQLDDTIGIHEQVVKIDPSHMPAISLVPPGMHRINLKGEGKASKRNNKRRQLVQQNDQKVTNVEAPTSELIDQLEQEQHHHNYSVASLKVVDSTGTTLSSTATEVTTTNTKTSSASVPAASIPTTTFFKPRSTIVHKQQQRRVTNHAHGNTGNSSQRPKPRLNLK